MKAKLTKITGIYTLLNDNDRMVASDDVDMQKDYEIGKLSTKNCDEIFGVVDVEKLATGYDLYEKINFVGQTRAYKAGFQKAMELSKDKLFTVEDMRTAMTYGVVQEGTGFEGIHSVDDLFNLILRKVSQPTEIEVEIEMIKTPDAIFQFHDVPYSTPKLDSEGCLILKKI